MLIFLVIIFIFFVLNTSIHTLAVFKAATTSFPWCSLRTSHTLQKTATPQPPGTSRVHAQSLPHNDGPCHPCCILKPPCTEKAFGNHLQASTARELRTKCILGMETPNVAHLLLRIGSSGGRVATAPKKKIRKERKTNHFLKKNTTKKNKKGK